jgi:hypothetical protein
MNQPAVTQEDPSKAHAYDPSIDQDFTPRQMVPAAWRRIVDQLLGPEVTLEVQDSADGNFIGFFYMPEGVDRRIGDAKGKGRDCSTGLIRRASAAADLESWCKRILENVRKTHPNFNKV